MLVCWVIREVGWNGDIPKRMNAMPQAAHIAAWRAKPVPKRLNFGIFFIPFSSLLKSHVGIFDLSSISWIQFPSRKWVDASLYMCIVGSSSLMCDIGQTPSTPATARITES